MNSTPRVAARTPTRVCPMVKRISAGSEATSMRPSTKRDQTALGLRVRHTTVPLTTESLDCIGVKTVLDWL